MLVISTSTHRDAEKQYILHVVLKEFLGLNYKIHWSGVESNYFEISLSGNSDDELRVSNIFLNTSNEDWLRPTSLFISPASYCNVPDIGKTDLLKQIPIFHEIMGNVVNPSKDTISLDIFGVIFYFLTLYEEFVLDKKDHHERFDFKESILYKTGLYRRPIVNEYVEILWLSLQKKWPRLERCKRSYNIDLSHDVDQPFSYNRPFTQVVRNIGGDFLRRGSYMTGLRKIASVLMNKSNWDPTNNFEYLMDISEKHGIKSTFNFIPINGQGNIDGAYDINWPLVQSLLKKINNRGHIIGFHPGYYTYDNLNELTRQYKNLNELCLSLDLPEVRLGRHHYLRWNVKSSWRHWDQIGLKSDSTVGYSGLDGFRVGCCYPYSVFDLSSRQHLNLIENPLLVMDINVEHEIGLSQFLEKIVQISNEVKKHQGSLTLLYHNNYVVSLQEKRFYENLIATLN